MIAGLVLGFVLVILSKKSIYCLGFGFILLGLEIVYYAYEKSKALQKTIFEVNEELSKTSTEDFMYIAELNKIKKQLTRQKNFTCFMFYLCGALLAVFGLISMF